MMPAATGVLMPTAELADDWAAGIDDEVERLLRNEVGDPTLGVPPVPPPARKPKLTSALLFKLPGGVSGSIGKQLIRAKEIERRLGIARSKHAKEKREKRTEEKGSADWSAAATAMKDLEEQHNFELSKLLVPALQALVRCLKLGNGAGRKALHASSSITSKLS